MNIKFIQIQLLLAVKLESKMYVQIEWSNKLGIIHFYVKNKVLRSTIHESMLNHSSYFGKLYKIKRIKVLEIVSKNPHIKI